MILENELLNMPLLLGFTTPFDRTLYKFRTFMRIGLYFFVKLKRNYRIHEFKARI